jgi:hypothetical protein
LTFQSSTNSNNLYGGERHLFRIPMHSVEVELRKPENQVVFLRGHHKHCSFCGLRLAAIFYDRQFQLLCVQQLCDRAENVHFWVSIDSKTIKRDLVSTSESSMGYAAHQLGSSMYHSARDLNVHRITTVGEPPEPIDFSDMSSPRPHDMRKVTNICLTASTLIKLSKYNIKRQYTTKTTLELCSKALEKNGPINRSQGMRPKRVCNSR